VTRSGEYGGILHIRRHLAATPVFKGVPDFRDTRIAMLRAETMEELFDIMERARKLVNAHEVQTDVNNTISTD
jgi:hypothetical protein